MEYVLPFRMANAKDFEQCAIKVGFDRFIFRKFMYINQESDIDIFMLMGDQRVSLLLYAWKLCDKYIQKNNKKIDAVVATIHKQLLYYTLHIWFSKEWQYCSHLRKAALLYCLGKAQVYLKRYKEMHELNWRYILDLDIYPWANAYVTKILKTAGLNNECVTVTEYFEPNPTVEDIRFLTQEGLALITLRLVQLFNMNYMPAVLQLAIRTIIAWNALKAKKHKHVLPVTDTKYLQLICHIYIMAVYTTDSTEGRIVDHLLYNIRFYYKSIKSKPLAENKKNANFTAARHIALTCYLLQLSLDNFFQSIVINSYDECTTTLFGALTQCYRSYVLGNLLMELNALNDEDFLKHYEQYKRLMDLYVDIREHSEAYVLNEIRKQEKQITSHNKTHTMDMGVDWKSMICKGNRFLKSEEEVKQHADEDNMDNRIDPVFQNMPKNLEILDYTYKALADRQYNGWHFAKLVLLLKIISLKLNRLESWHYHMGLTADFIIELEHSIASHFEDLAKIFHDHPFIEQELWLTAFYLSPKQHYFDTVTRCGLRFKRMTAPKTPEPKVERAPVNVMNAKYGLLSSTVDIRGIFHMSSHDAPNEDYVPLTNALRGIQLPEALIKDLLIVTFVPRHRHFSWAVQWTDLRRRCKDFLQNNTLKRRCVELNMAEANNRLKYLKVDYRKYQHRPQLDYGSIERGYEYPSSYGGDCDTDSEDEEEEDIKESPEPPSKKPKPTHISPTIADSIFANTRRTRARVAAVIEAHTGARSVEATDDDGSDAEQAPEQAPVTKASTPPATVVAAEGAHTTTAAQPAELKLYSNSTEGFNKFRDIWNKSQIEIRPQLPQPAMQKNDVIVAKSMLPGAIEYQKNRLKGFDELSALQANVADVSSSDLEEAYAEEENNLNLFDIDESSLLTSESAHDEAVVAGDCTTQLDKIAAAPAKTTNSGLTTREGSPALTELDFNSFISINSEEQDPDSDRSDYSTTARRDSEEIDEPPSSPTAAQENNNKSTPKKISPNATEIDLFDESRLVAARQLGESDKAATDTAKAAKDQDVSTASALTESLTATATHAQRTGAARDSSATASLTKHAAEETLQLALKKVDNSKAQAKQQQKAAHRKDAAVRESAVSAINIKDIDRYANTKSSKAAASSALEKASEKDEKDSSGPRSTQARPEATTQEMVQKLKEKLALREVRIRIKRSPSALIAQTVLTTTEQTASVKINKSCKSITEGSTEQPSVMSTSKTIIEQQLRAKAQHKHVPALPKVKRSISSEPSLEESSSSKKRESTEEDAESNEISSEGKDLCTDNMEVIEEYITIEPAGDEIFEEEILPDDEEIMDDKLKLECLQRKAYVNLERLQTKDLMKLRQPKVLLKRIKSWTNLSKASKSRTASSSSSNISGVLKRKLSNALSLNEEPQMKSTRADSTDSSSNSPLLSSRRKKLMVTPRSASGLKLRICSVGQETGEQVLTTSSASSTPPHSTTKKRLKRKKPMAQLAEMSDNDYNTDEDDEELIVVDDADFIPEDSTKHPLYEEEIII